MAGAEGLGAAVVKLDVGAAVVPLRGVEGPTGALELTGVAGMGRTVKAEELAGTVGSGVGVSNDVPLVGSVALVVGMAGLEPLADTGVGMVALVGKAVTRTEEFENGAMPVVEAVVFVGRGITRVVELNGMTTLIDGAAVDDELPMVMGKGAKPVPNGAGVDKVPLEVGKGGDVTAEPGTGPSNVVLFKGTVMVVATAVPLTVIVETMAVTDGEDVMFVVGKGARRVVEFMGMTTLVAATEPLTLTVVALAVMMDVLSGGGRSEADGAKGIVVTTGEVVFEYGGTTATTSDHNQHRGRQCKNLLDA